MLETLVQLKAHALSQILSKQSNQKADCCHLDFAMARPSLDSRGNRCISRAENLLLQDAIQLNALPPVRRESDTSNLATLHD
jgi:hypothetical protein